MTVIWLVIIAVVVIFFSLAFWLISKDISDSLADIRHGKGIFLTFNYPPQEWKYYAQTLPFTGQSGKVCFTGRHIYLSDGTEEILYEIFGPTARSARLRKIFLDNDFVVFTVRNKELIAEEGDQIKIDSPDNLIEYHILIPKSQQQQTGELISFYQKMINKHS
jgi:hypothetical protein